MQSRAVALGVLLTLSSVPSQPVEGQTAETLAMDCATLGGEPALCTRAAAAGRDLMGDVGVLAGPGSDVPGQSSTLGRRLGGAPRMAASLRLGALSTVQPELRDASSSAERSSLVPAVHAGLGLGLFDGFRLLPTVGGFLSLDVFGQGSFLFFPEGKGFDGRLDVLAVGARVGLLRESFTLPGVTVSASRRLSGALGLGDTTGGDAAEVQLDPSVTSVRAIVGKDLFAFGIHGGVGWDDYSGETAIRATDGAGGYAEARASLEGTRRTYFVGLSRQLGVLSWISAEVGWFEAFDPVVLAGVTSPDRGWTVFGSLAFLFKL